jgi:hypothetical protein
MHIMPYHFSKPIGYYPPLLWKPIEPSGHQENPLILRLVIAFNLLLRFLFYSISLIFSAVVTAAIILIATVFNIGCLLGGYFSDAWCQQTKQFNHMAFIRCQWLILDGFAFLWNQAKLLLGLFQPQYAIPTLNTLQKLTEDLAQISLFHFDWQRPHIEKVKSIADTYGGMIRMILCSISAEPVETILCSIRLLKGLGSDSHAHGLNPETLTAEQAKHPAILLIHGNYCNQGVWFPLAEYFHKKGYPGPIFTVNLPAGEITDRDCEIIEQKLMAILDCYGTETASSIPIHVIGHSRGATLTDHLERHYHKYQRLLSVNKKIVLGSYHSSSDQQLIIIRARDDILVEYTPPTGPLGTNLTIDTTGHTGLVAHPETIKYCFNLLNPEKREHPPSTQNSPGFAH